MAIKTIRGPLAPMRQRFTCGNQKCQAVLEVSTDDGRYCSDGRDGDYYSFHCPHCNIETTVDARRFLTPLRYTDDGR